MVAIGGPPMVLFIKETNAVEFLHIRALNYVHRTVQLHLSDCNAQSKPAYSLLKVGGQNIDNFANIRKCFLVSIIRC